MLNKKKKMGSKSSPDLADKNSTGKSVPDVNEKFVDACENGDYQMVTKILEVIKDFNINVTDNLGRTALRLAVENEHLEVNEISFNCLYSIVL